MANDSSVNLKPLKTFKLLGETVEMVVTHAEVHAVITRLTQGWLTNR